MLAFGKNRSFVTYNPSPNESMPMHKSAAQRLDEESVCSGAGALLQLMELQEELSGESERREEEQSLVRQLSTTRRPAIHDAVKVRYVIYDRIITCPPQI
jgi:hypothetical protein